MNFPYRLEMNSKTNKNIKIDKNPSISQKVVLQQIVNYFINVNN